MKKKIPVLSIVLYVFAVLFAIYAVWTIYLISDYYLKQPSGEGAYSIIATFMTNASQYVFFAIVLATLGWILQRFSPATEKTAVPVFDEPEAFAQPGVFTDVAEEVNKAEAENPDQTENADKQD